LLLLWLFILVFFSFYRCLCNWISKEGFAIHLYVDLVALEF
jgi:hypothetical protein